MYVCRVNMTRVDTLGVMAGMDSPSARLRWAREQKYRSGAEAARALGMGASTYNAHENGQNAFDFEQAEIYGQKFGVTATWLLKGDGAPAAPTPQRERANARIGKPIEDPFSWQTIPVYGQAVGGVDGRFIFNGQKITDVIAPPSLGNVAGAYAVYVVGDSMEPRYFAGETIYVHPRLPIRKGDFVVVQVKADDDHEHAPLGYVKQFVSMDERRLKLTQYNPAKTLEFPRHSVISIHKIVFTAPPT
jgi:phage repressor protein C with HTH and peptisase S24 domain